MIRATDHEALIMTPWCVIVHFGVTTLIFNYST